MEPIVGLASEGLSRAISRLENIDLGTDEIGGAIATGEALVWIASLEEVAGRRQGDRSQPAPPLPGLRYVRDRIAHQGAITAMVHTERLGLLGKGGPFGTGPPIGTTREGLLLRWRERDQMPPPDDAHNWQDRAESYDEQVAGRAVLPTLRAAVIILRRMMGNGG